MKKLLFLCCCVLACWQPLAAQEDIPDEQRLEKMEAMRAAFITNKVKLTPEESQRFWPIFNEMDDKLREVRKAKRPDRKLNAMTDAEAEQFITEFLKQEEQELAIKKDYYQRFRKVLPPKKILMLMKAEREFKGELLNKVRERREGGGEPPRGGGKRPPKME